MSTAPLLLVLGMHRSGTSLLAGVLERLGVALPGDVIAGDQHNPSGYFEWADVVALQERLLIDLDRWWPSAAGVEPLPADWLSAPATTAFRAALRGHLERSMAQQSDLWAIKDPRSSLLLPIWIDLARELGLPLRLVLAVRDPAEVVQSLLRRDAAVTGMNLGRAQRLWWLHNLSVLHALDDPRKLVVVDDSGWFRDPVAQLSHLEGAIPELCPTEEQRREALALIDPRHRHAVEPAVRQSLPSALISLHRRLLRQPLPRRWPSARPPSSLPGDSAALPSERELIAAPERWQPLLDELKHHPAPRRTTLNPPVQQPLLLSCCGATWMQWTTHLWLQRLPVQELAARAIARDQLDSPHQLLLRSGQGQPDSVLPPLRISLNLECPEPERIGAWLQHLRSQDLIWDPSPARVLLLRAVGLPAWWLDPEQPMNGWLQREEAAETSSWLEHLGLAPPPRDHLLVLGALDSGWDRALAHDAESQTALDPPVAYLPGWSQLITASPVAALAQAGWFVQARARATRVVWAQSSSLLQEALAAVNPSTKPDLTVSPPLDPEELRALHHGRPLMALAEDRPSPPQDVLFDWCREDTAPAVAVVVSSFNYASRINTALGSVSSQTASNLELIVVDDASTDDSAEVVRHWMAEQRQHSVAGDRRFCRLLLLRHQQNAGLATARNTAFAAARADWCFVLDADNRLLPRAVEDCLSLTVRLRDCSKLAVIHPVIGMEIEAGRADEQRSLLGGPSWQKERFLEGNIVDAMALVRRSAWRAVGGYTHLEGGWEDYDFWCKLVADGWQGVQCPQLLALYCSHTEAMTFRDTARRQRALSRTLQQRHPWLRLPLAS